MSRTADRISFSGHLALNGVPRMLRISAPLGSGTHGVLQELGQLPVDRDFPAVAALADQGDRGPVEASGSSRILCVSSRTQPWMR